MKKIYFLAASLVFGLSVIAQPINDDFEGYTPGPMGDQAPWWTTWSGATGGGEDIIVSTDQANSGSQSGFIGEGQGPQDAILLLGNKTSGDYTIQWQMYIPSGNEAYFNMQGEIPDGPITGVWNSGDIYFNQDGTNSGVGSDTANPDETFSFFHDVWFTTRLYVDVDAATYQLFVDGTAASSAPIDFQTDTTMGGLDFFAASPATTFYIDDLIYVEGELSNNDFEAISFNVYPNPVQDKLNIQSQDVVDQVAIYNVLGKLVYEGSPNVVSPSVDMSNFNSGVYFVEVTIGNASKTVKVIK